MVYLLCFFSPIRSTWHLNYQCCGRSCAPCSRRRQNFVMANSEQEINISQDQRMDVLQVSNGAGRRHMHIPGTCNPGTRLPGTWLPSGFLALSAACQATGPSVHYDACLDSGRASWRLLSVFNVAELALFFKGLRTASLSRVGAMENPRFFYSFFLNLAAPQHG